MLGPCYVSQPWIWLGFGLKVSFCGKVNIRVRVKMKIMDLGCLLVMMKVYGDGLVIGR